MEEDKGKRLDDGCRFLGVSVSERNEDNFTGSSGLFLFWGGRESTCCLNTHSLKLTDRGLQHRGALEWTRVLINATVVHRGKSIVSVRQRGGAKCGRERKGEAQ
jgi:hypothetical protein